MTERQLAVMVQRFEALATDIVTAHGGRVIKTVGDEILFVTIDAAPAAAVALDLVETMAEDDLLPDVRVGMAVGPVLSRLGDVFGTTVNRASRLTSVAPGRGRARRRRARLGAGDAVRASRRPPCAAAPCAASARSPPASCAAPPAAARSAQAIAPDRHRPWLHASPERPPHDRRPGPHRAPRRRRPRRRARARPPGGHERRLHRDGAGPGRATAELAQDPTVRAVVVSSTHPRAFCVGADLKERNSFTDDELRAQRPVAQAAYRGVLDLPVPGDRGGRRLRAGRRLRDRAVLRPRRLRRGRRRGPARGERRRHPRRRRHPAADPAGGLVAGGADDLHRAAVCRGRRVPPGRGRRGGRGRHCPRRGPSSWRPRSPANSPVGVRNAKARHAAGFRHRPGRRTAHRGRDAGPPRPSPGTAPRGSRRSTRNAVLTWPGR